MPTKSGAATFDDIKQGKTLWHVYAVYKNDGSIRLLSKEPEPYRITGRPYQMKEHKGETLGTFWWFNRLYEGLFGEYHITHASLSDCHVATPTEKPSPFQTNRLFVSRRAAVKYIEMFKRTSPTLAHRKRLEWLQCVDDAFDIPIGADWGYSHESETASELDFSNRDEYMVEQQQES